MPVSLPEFNPILKRESRARWRRRAFGLLFAGAALLALVMFFAYKSATANWQMSGNFIQREASAVGPEVFKALTYYQVIAWMFLAPAITATAIASERERGLLEALQLSALTPGAIMRGKLFSALSFMALLMLSTLPIIAICFLLGGVSPGEFYAAALQIFLTALLGSSMGLCVSSRCRRASQAIGGAMGSVLMWSLGTYILLIFAMFFGFKKWVTLAEVSCFFILFNPVYTLAMSQGVVPPGLPAPTFVPFDIAPTGWLMQSVLSLFLLWLCVRAVRRPFDEQYWVEIGPAMSARDLLANEAGAAPPSLPSPTTRALWQAPVAQRIHLNNPIMQRDLRAKFIFRRVKPLAMAFQTLLLLGLSGLYWWLVWIAFTDRNSHETIWGIASGGLLFGLMLAPALTGANSITREREAGTWEGIRLSLLSPWEIIGGKHIGAVALAPLLCLLLVPFALVCWLVPHLGEPDYYRPITLWQILITLLLLHSVAWMSSAWGMLVSWYSKRTATATGWTIGSLFIILVLAPSLGAVVLDGLGSEGREIQRFLWNLHPFQAFLQIFESTRDAQDSLFFLWNGPWITLRAALLYFAIGTALLLFLNSLMATQTSSDE